jgi:cholesterol oxidase
MRLSQKGYRVAVLEMGKEWANKDFPKSNWIAHKFLWAPILRCFGIQKISLLKKVMILHGVGVGGGSLVYANTLMTPPQHVFASTWWPKGRNWWSELAPFYEVAKKMLGVQTNPYLDTREHALKKIAGKMGIEHTFHATDVGVHFGAPDVKIPDPYFNGQGPDRVGCIYCGACMIGCPNGSKNTLDKNYLYFARAWGAKIFAETKVTSISSMPNGNYRIETIKSTSWFSRPGDTFIAKKVILSAGVLGTLDILMKNRDIYKTLPNVSERLGRIVRTNGEALLGATSMNENLEMSKGIAIGAAIHPDAQTKIETVRYPNGSDLLKFMAVPLTGSGGALLRPLKMLGNFALQFPKYLRLMFTKDWAKSTIILLVMQSSESKMRLRLGRSILTFFKKGMVGGVEDGDSIPSYFEVAQDAAKHLAKEIDGVPQNVFSEVLLQTPATAHILGGAIMGDSSSTGVVDEKHEVYGHPGLYVCDASVIPANLAVNPSLTITAMSERFASLFPTNPEMQNWKTPELTFTVKAIGK